MAKLHISCIDILNLFDDKRFTKNSLREGVGETESFYLCEERVRRYYESSCILFVIGCRNHLAQLSLPLTL